MGRVAAWVCPVTVEYADAAGRRSDFQRGAITLDPTTGATTVIYF